VIARLERNVQSRPANVAAAFGRVAQRLFLGVRLAARSMKTFAERRRAKRQHRTDNGIRRRAPAPAFRELAGASQVDAIERRERGLRYG
jgi:hypothetical protein